MKKLFTLIFAFTTVSIFSQAPTFQWANSTGSSVLDKSAGVVTDASGNVYTTGFFQNTTDFDPGAGIFNLISNGVKDFYISKLDPNGNFVWVKGIGGISNDVANAITIDASGNIYITGFFGNTVDFDPGAGVTNLTSAGFNDVFVLKLDASGNFVWAKAMGGISANDEGVSIAVDASGNVHTTGFFQGNGDYDPGAGVSTLTLSGGSDIFISKLDAAGNFVWAKALSGTNTEFTSAISLDASGNVFTVGHFAGTVDFDPNAGVSNLVSNGAPTDIFVSKLDPSGNYLWAGKMGGTQNDYAFSLTIDGSGNIYTTGYYAGTSDFDPGVGVSNLTVVGAGDIYVSKLDNSGNFVWVKNIGGPNNEQAYSIDLDPLGNIYFTGYFQTGTDFDPGPGTTSLTSISNSNDVFICKLNSLGSFVWVKAMGGSGTEQGNSIIADGSGNILSTGVFNGLGDYNPDIGVLNLNTNGSDDNFIHKMSQCLTPASPTNTTPLQNQTICTNNTASITASGSGTISWYATPTSTTVLGTGTNYITPSLTVGTYTYYAEAATCTISASRTPITITVNPNPAVTASSNASLLCVGQSATLTASGANTYTWNPGGTGTTIVVSPTTNTTYTVNGSDVNGCQNTTTVVQSVTVCSSTDLNQLASNTVELTIYPNPTGNHITIELSSINENTSIEIYSSTGQLLIAEKVTSSKHQINLNSLNTGIYFVKVKGESGFVIKKVIKE